jgi:hypothetical protein
LNAVRAVNANRRVTSCRQDSPREVVLDGDDSSGEGSELRPQEKRAHLKLIAFEQGRRVARVFRRPNREVVSDSVNQRKLTKRISERLFICRSTSHFETFGQVKQESRRKK